MALSAKLSGRTSFDAIRKNVFALLFSYPDPGRPKQQRPAGNNRGKKQKLCPTKIDMKRLATESTKEVYDQ